MFTPQGASSATIIDIPEPLSNEQLARRLSFDTEHLFDDDLGFDYFKTCRSKPSASKTMAKQQSQPTPKFMMPMPLHLRTFHGYNEEDGEKFLNDFVAFSSMSGFDDDRMVSAFSLYLAGPAYNWYKSLENDIQRDWQSLKQYFIEHYATANEALLYSEIQLYNELKLKDKTNLEDYYSEIVKRGRKLKKASLT